MIDPHKITFEIMELLLLIYKILLIYLDLHVPIFFCFLFYLDLHVSNFFYSSMSLFTKRQKGVFMKEIVQIFEVPLVHKVTKFIQTQQVA